MGLLWWVLALVEESVAGGVVALVTGGLEALLAVEMVVGGRGLYS